VPYIGEICYCFVLSNEYIFVKSEWNKPARRIDIVFIHHDNADVILLL